MSSNRQIDVYRRSFIGARFYIDIATVHGNYRMADRQSEAASFFAGGKIGIKNLWQIFLADSAAIVLYSDPCVKSVAQRQSTFGGYFGIFNRDTQFPAIAW